MRVDHGISPYVHTLNRSQSSVLRTMLRFRRKYPSLQAMCQRNCAQRTKIGFEIKNPCSERPSGAIFHQISDFIKISKIQQNAPVSLARACRSDFRPKVQTSDGFSEQVLDSWKFMVSIFMSGVI